MNLTSTIDPPLKKPAPQDPKIFAEVVLNLPVRESFTYSVPPQFIPYLQPGIRVFVPFGRRKLTGYVVSLSDRCDSSFTLKNIEDVLDTEPVLSREILALTRWIADYYQASWGEAVKAALPAGLEDESHEILTLTPSGEKTLTQQGLKESMSLILSAVKKRGEITPKQIQRHLQKKFSAHTLARLKQKGWLQSQLQIKRSTVGYQYEKLARVVSPTPDEQEVEKILHRSPKQQAVYASLLEGEKTLKELAAKIPAYAAPFRKLREKELVEVVTIKTHRQNTGDEPRSTEEIESPLPLTPDQKQTYEEIKHSLDRSEFQTYLLHGVTGSGKTEVYMRCIQTALDLNKKAVMMVPEISLTPQTVTRFLKRFGKNVAILHSGLSQRERYQEWKKIREGQVSIVVGARSSIFAPLKNLGVIVIDEEHDTSYKQDSTPRYHARDTAIVRARSEKAVVILGSATPSLESLANTESGKYRYLSLDKRVQDRLLPVVQLVDMQKEKDENKNFSILSGKLKTAIRSRLDRKEQVFLFLNRRGTANYVFCKECGFVFDCHHCSVTLTFHGRENRIRCHYCNYTARVPTTCADCKGEVIKFSGFGTQRLEDEIHRLYPEARTVRLDRDTTRGRSAFASMHRLMSAGEIDILIGTQMITKGHDFPHVTLVGVVHADLSLNIPDFRSCERSFQLMTQVAGRAGRGQIPGQVLIQTHNPRHYVFDFVKAHDFKKFSEKEMVSRRQLNYPPFTRLAALEIESESEKTAEAAAGKLKSCLMRIIARIPDIELMGASPAALYQIKNKYRWHILLKSKKAQTLQSILHQLRDLKELKSPFMNKVKFSIDVDPVNLL
ncbi:MAG: primosomal protein N' [Nitrospinaceae bacterium]|nr:MAG: primosomal protein N' [Nitrospinaceae bacterium]